MTAPLPEPLERLYGVMARYPRPSGAVECTHCVPESVQEVLRRPPLRELGEDLLTPVALNAGVGTFGGADEFRHFLPRLLELLWPFPGAAWPAGMVLHGLPLHGADAWPEEEQAAVAEALLAWMLSVAPSEEDAFDAVGALQERAAVASEVTPDPERWPALLEALDPVRLGWVVDSLLDAPEGARILAGAEERLARRLEVGAAAVSDPWWPTTLAARLRAAAKRG